jgi:large subunit ribosomal protein L2
MAVSMKEVFWNGTKRSLDPTAPSVVPRRPTTPSQRHTAIIDKSLIWRKGPVSKLTVGLNKTGGRNNQGVITVRHRGGGAKRRYRLVDFKRVHANDTSTVKGTVERIEYDPNRSAFIALLKHTVEAADGAPPSAAAPLSYIICPRGITVGMELVASRTRAVDVRPGNTMLLRYIPVGTVIHNIELKPGRCAALLRGR